MAVPSSPASVPAAASNAPAAPVTPAAGVAAQAAQPVPPPAAGASADAKPADQAAAKPGEWSLKLPDGAQYAEKGLKAVETFAKEHGLSQAQAEKLLGWQIKDHGDRTAAQAAEVAQVGTQWLEAAKADTEIGGAKFEATQQNVKRAMMAVLSEADRKAVADSPFANNPVWLKAMNKVAALLPSEDSVFGTHQVPGDTRTPSEKMYPMYSKR
jgi:predicted metalloendopeptidase